MGTKVLDPVECIGYGGDGREETFGHSPFRSRDAIGLSRKKNRYSSRSDE